LHVYTPLQETRHERVVSCSKLNSEDAACRSTVDIDQLNPTEMSDDSRFACDVLPLRKLVFTEFLRQRHGSYDLMALHK